MRKLVAYYEELVDKTHARKIECLKNLMMNKNELDIELEPINKTLKEFDSKLKRDNVDFILRTLDGDKVKWKEIQTECDNIMAKIKSLDKQLNEIIFEDRVIGFKIGYNHIFHSRIEDVCGFLGTRVLESSILTSFKMENVLFQLFSGGDELNYELIYRASRDGFEASSSHAKCDKRGDTLTIIRTTNECIFGGYTKTEWDSKSGYKADRHAFLFSLGGIHSKPFTLPVNQRNKRAICCKAGFGPIFGDGQGIMICNNSNATAESYYNFGNTYQPPQSDNGTAQAQWFPASQRNFQTSEI